MSIKRWKVVAELNMCAEREVAVVVESSTKKKAIKRAEERLKKDGAFFVLIREVELLN